MRRFGIVLSALCGVLAATSQLAGAGTAGAARETRALPSATTVAPTASIESVETTLAKWDPWQLKVQGAAPPTTRFRWAWIRLAAGNPTDRPVTLQCKLDGSAWEACGTVNPKGGIRTRKSLKGLAPGLHTFRVRAVDAAGRIFSTPAEKRTTVFSWRVTGSATVTPPPPPTPKPGLERPTIAEAKSAITKYYEDDPFARWVRQHNPGVRPTVVFRSFKLGATRLATAEDRSRSENPPPLRKAVTWTSHHVDQIFAVVRDVNGEQRKVCSGWRKRGDGLFWKRNGRWTLSVWPDSRGHSDEIKPYLC